MAEIDKNHGHRIGLAKYPKQLNSSSIRNLVYDAWKVQGIREKLSDPYKKRHEFKSSHCFRKFFETKCQQGQMNHNHIKLLIDHSLGESQNYHKPDENQLLQDYYNHGIDLLTIDETNKLKKKIQTLEVEKSLMDQLRDEILSIKKQMKTSL